jgi:hypothetical protein
MMVSIMGAIKDLWQSERGLVAIALIAACTVLSATSIISPEQWLDYTKWVFITYAAAKTVTSVAALASADPSAANVIDLLSAAIHASSAASTAPAAQTYPAPPTAVPTPPAPIDNAPKDP